MEDIITVNSFIDGVDSSVDIIVGSEEFDLIEILLEETKTVYRVSEDEFNNLKASLSREDANDVKRILQTGTLGSKGE